MWSLSSSSSAGPSRIPSSTRSRQPLIFLSLLATLLPTSLAATVTVYTGGPSATTTSLAPGASYTGLGAYDPTRLTAPTPPQPPATTNSISVPESAASASAQGHAVSIPQRGNFLGFSIELSVADVVLGKSGEQLKPEFLNYLANIQTRAGQGPVVRVGGNTQEGATIWADGLGDAAEVDKLHWYIDSSGNNDTLNSPLVNYSPMLFYTMANISSLTSTEWYYGLSFNQTAASQPTVNAPIAAKYAEQILGSSLRGLAIGNEPDLYTDHGVRPQGWGISDYITEYTDMANTVVSSATLSNQQIFVGPAVCCQVQGFELADVFNAGFLNTSSSLAAVTVQHYPRNNCKIGGITINPQDIFAEYLNHTNAQYLTSLYLQDSALSLQAGKQLVMLETNTASCGGFPGLSDSFGAAMWMADFALEMAWGNFSAALMHVGGQGTYYNPFTPPPGGSGYTGWTTGSVYYASLLVAEAFGKSNQSQIVDLSGTDVNADETRPIYAIYENDVLTRMVLFNFIDDPSGASTINTVVQGGFPATSVFVRYLTASSVSEQYNITWAGQTLGTSFASDGRLYGDQATVTINCEYGGHCTIPVYAPSIALVFFSQDAVNNSSPTPNATSTFATTVMGTGSATVNPQVLETSNGQNGPAGQAGSTSEQSAAKSSAARRTVGTSLGVLAMGFVMIRTILAAV